MMSSRIQNNLIRLNLCAGLYDSPMVVENEALAHIQDFRIMFITESTARRRASTRGKHLCSLCGSVYNHSVRLLLYSSRLGARRTRSEEDEVEFLL
jgi:hypothetical protein